MPKIPSTKDRIRKRFQELLKDKKITSQQRGFEFEKLINKLLKHESLKPRTSYNRKGEQIDGSFFWAGQTFLIEAKWTKKDIPASSIYEFKGKIDGKFHTTSGVFLSANNYSKDAVDALMKGKSLNILLFNKNDISIIFNGEVTFKEILKFKLRQAGDTGSLLVPYKLKEKVQKIANKKSTKLIKQVEKTPFQGDIFIKKSNAVEDLLVFVESRNDIKIIDKFLSFFERRFFLSYKIESLGGTGNIRQLPSILNIYSDYENPRFVVVILDADQRNSQINDLINNITNQLEKSLIDINIKFFFINEDLKEKLIKKEVQYEEIYSEQLFIDLEEFIFNLERDNYFPEYDIPRKSLKRTSEEIKWDIENNEIKVYDYMYDRYTSIKTLDELIDFFNEQIVYDFESEMPVEWLSEHRPIDYTMEVKGFLYDNLYDKIEQIGWDTNDL